MSSPRKSPPDLLSLPNEVLARICRFVALLPITALWSDLEPKHISNLRLTCKHLHAPATTEFARFHLDKPVTMFTRHSLESLAELCKHPLFGSQVRDVAFYPLRLDNHVVYQAENKLNASISTRDLRGIVEARKDLNTYSEYLEEELHLEQSGEAVKLLKEIFCSLRPHGKSIGISLLGNKIRTGFGRFRRRAVPPIGYLTAVEKLSCREEDVWNHVLNLDGLALTFRMMLEAAVKSNCKISSLNLQTPDTNWRDANVVSSADQAVSEALAALKSIKIDLHHGPLLRSLGNVLQRTLPHARGLERLHLSALNEDPPITVAWHEGCSLFFLDSAIYVLGSIASDALVRIQLEDIPVRATDLLKFLDKHERTLTELALIRIPLKGKWEDVLMWIEEHPCFEKLCLMCMFTMGQRVDNHWVETSPWFTGGFGASGRDEVHLETDRFLKYLRRYRAGEKVVDREEYELDYDDFCNLRTEFMSD